MATALPTERGKSAVEANLSILNDTEKSTVELLLSCDQGHLFANWPAVGSNDADKHRFLSQVAQIEKDYLGGVRQYILRAKQLLSFALKGGNPYEGYSVSEPTDSVRLETAADFDKYENIGLSSIGSTAFVIVAGGLGERLGYKGIKLALPSEIVTETTYIQLYIKHILALQSIARIMQNQPDLLLPLAIMTSDDTDQLTRELLSNNSNYGMIPEQLIIFKQGKVPSLIDNSAHFCLDESDPFQLDTKPHGHGDVHMLLYQHSIVNKWVNQQSIKYIVFFQDTNGLVFKAIPAALGVSVEKKLQVNSITVPRVQGDAVGAICTLKRSTAAAAAAAAAENKDSESLPDNLTINVEYNQLEGLLGKGIKEPIVNGTNNISVYPGNINVLIFDAIDYLRVLDSKKGVISEFVNPKYNPDKQSFKKPTRLECMMQDYPKLLSNTATVGFSQFQRWTSFSAVKNAINDGADKQKQGNAAEVAATGEADMYYWNYRILSELGVDIDQPVPTVFKRITVDLPPKIVLTPRFGSTQSEVRKRFNNPSAVHIRNPNQNTALVLDGNGITVNSLNLIGSLVIEAVDGANVTIDGLTVNNSGWIFEELSDNTTVNQQYSIRGYTVNKLSSEFYRFTEAGNYTLSDATKQQFISNRK